MDDAGLGARISRFRKDLDLTQAELARRSDVSAAYISELEKGLGRRPSGAILLQLAEALGVTVAELLGKDVRPAENPDVLPEGLPEFAAERDLPQADVDMLAGIRFRGEPPRSARRWAIIYDTIVSSRSFDAR